jgi:hypothetical protein
MSQAPARFRPGWEAYRQMTILARNFRPDLKHCQTMCFGIYQAFADMISILEGQGNK